MFVVPPLPTEYTPHPNDVAVVIKIAIDIVHEADV
jgi:hypothetical protein